jgi:hypothetical protein
VRGASPPSPLHPRCHLATVLCPWLWAAKYAEWALYTPNHTVVHWVSLAVRVTAQPDSELCRWAAQSFEEKAMFAAARHVVRAIFHHRFRIIS